jgi:excisionase family DNA binding protein
VNQELLTVVEAGKRLRLQESTIRAWILKRKIPFVRLGRRVFVRNSDCQELINANVVMPEKLGRTESGKRSPLVMRTFGDSHP